MTYLILKALLSGLIVAAASETARRWPGVGALIVSLPLVSLLTFLWLWRDSGDPARIADLSQSAFWYFLPSMPMFLAWLTFVPLMIWDRKSLGRLHWATKLGAGLAGTYYVIAVAALASPVWPGIAAHLPGV